MSKKITNADQVRSRITTAIILEESADIVVTWAIDALGMKKQLAKVYVKNLWPQVAAKLETTGSTPATEVIETPTTEVIETPPVEETPKEAKRKAKAAKKKAEPVIEAVTEVPIEQPEEVIEVPETKIVSFDEDFNSYDDGADLIANFNEDYGSFSMS